jgi:hypothetical protein
LEYKLETPKWAVQQESRLYEFCLELLVEFCLSFLLGNWLQGYAFMKQVASHSTFYTGIELPEVGARELG